MTLIMGGDWVETWQHFGGYYSGMYMMYAATQVDVVVATDIHEAGQVVHAAVYLLLFVYI